MSGEGLCPVTDVIGCAIQLSTQYSGTNSMNPGLHFDDDDDDDDEDEDFVDGTSYFGPIVHTYLSTKMLRKACSSSSSSS